MGAVRLLIRSEVRRRWRSLVVVALVVGFAGTVTLAAVAGARRTSTSFNRFRESTRGHDVLLLGRDIGRRDVERLRSLPGVEAIGYARQFALVRPNGDFLTVAGPLDDALFRDVNRVRIVAGRAPAPGAAEEVTIDEPLARTSRLRPGDVLPVHSYTQDQIDQADPNAETPEPGGPELRLRVVGISRSPIDLSLQGTAGGSVILPRSFVEKYDARIGDLEGDAAGVLFVRLTDGAAGVPRFLDQLRRVLGDRGFDVDPAAVTIGGVQDSIDLLAIGILVFGAIVGIAGLIALALIISRQVALLAAGQSAARDLGLTRPLRATALAGPVLLAVGAGAVVATLGAWAASPLMPFGIAGRAEPHPGLHFDVPALGIGAIAIAVLLGSVVVVTAARVARSEESADRARLRPSVLTRSLETLGIAPAATIGVRMALEPGRGRTAVPVRSSLVGAAVAVLGVTAVVVFAASLDHLVETPHSYGINWDARVIDARLESDGHRCGRQATRLTAEPAVGAIANVCTASIALDGRATGGVGITPLRGSIQPTVLEGRAPSRADEVAIGTHTADTLGLGVGDRVTGRSPAGTHEYRIVGRVVVPSLLPDPQAIADGAVFTGDGLGRLDDPETDDGSAALVVGFRPGVDHVAAARRIARLPDVEDVAIPGVGRTGVPLEVARIQQLDRLPIALAGFLAILGALAIGHLLITSVQRRRRDFAVLKSLGFRRSQLYATVGAEATTVACVGIIAGLVAGVATGSLLWRLTAEQVGVVPGVDVPVLGLAGVALVALVIANLVAALPAHIAARTRPAVLLRTE